MRFGGAAVEAHELVEGRDRATGAGSPDRPVAVRPSRLARCAARADQSLHVRLHQDLQDRLSDHPQSAFSTRSANANFSSVIGISFGSKVQLQLHL